MNKINVKLELRSVYFKLFLAIFLPIILSAIFTAPAPAQAAVEFTAITVMAGCV